MPNWVKIGGARLNLDDISAYWKHQTNDGTFQIKVRYKDILEAKWFGFGKDFDARDKAFAAMDERLFSTEVR